MSRLKGPSKEIRAWCGRCGFLVIITGRDGKAPTLSYEEDARVSRGEAEVWKSNAPPAGGDMCPRCMGDAWGYRTEPLETEQVEEPEQEPEQTD